MSIFGAMNSAISGLTAQSDAFGNISDDVANSQTVGFKRVDTSFVDFLTVSTPTSNQPGAVVAQPDYINNVQGAITQTDNPLNLAVAGQGFFAVSEETGQVNGHPTFNPQQFYTRAGDFSLNSQGFLVNSSNEYLNGWLANPATGSSIRTRYFQSRSRNPRSIPWRPRMSICPRTSPPLRRPEPPPSPRQSPPTSPCMTRLAPRTRCNST